MTDFAHIRIDRHEGGIAAVVVARADIGNASSPEMLGEIRDAFAALSADRDARAILFAAELGEWGAIYLERGLCVAELREMARARGVSH